ncbi:MAG: DNA primase [Trueperaceae bacterium]|nr:DNA primase [Trueperaceae bacterium]
MAADAKSQIKERLNIADVVGEVVALKPAGRGQLKGLCPFHSEKTPSFHVHVDRGYFYCFGCHAKGDVFDFVMRTQSLGFPDALRLLGARAGVEVTVGQGGEPHRRDLYDVNQLALDYFRSHLAGPPLDYLVGRGLTTATVTAFELGYAPAGWDGLLRHALAKGVREDDLLALGLVIESERGRRFDRFRDRVMFPIRDGLSRLVGFAGRVMDGSQPKYMNSPESELFRKGELLYALDRARADIRRSGEVIVVEGYMDVIALHQVGLANTVAALGATLTAEQGDALARLDVHAVKLAFDADEAGQRAVLAGLDQAVGRSFVVTAVSVPHGKDPAEAVLGGHLDEFRAALERGVSEVEFRFRRVAERHDVTTLTGQRAVLEELQGVLRPRAVFDPVAAEMRRLVIEHLAIDAARLDDWLAGHARRAPSPTEMRGMRSRRLELGQARRLELEVVALLLMEPRALAERLGRVLAGLPDQGADSLLVEFERRCRRLDFDADAVLAEYQGLDDGAVVLERLLRAEAEDDGRIDVEDQLVKAMSRLRELDLEEQKEEGRARLLARRAQLARDLEDGAADGAALADLYDELHEIQGVLTARDAERRLRVQGSFSKRRKRRG